MNDLFRTLSKNGVFVRRTKRSLVFGNMEELQTSRNSDTPIKMDH